MNLEMNTIGRALLRVRSLAKAAARDGSPQLLTISSHALLSVIGLMVLCACGCQPKLQSSSGSVLTNSSLTAARPGRFVTATAGLNEPLAPLPVLAPWKKDNEREKVHLGKLLFHDRRLSIDNSVSCASCHNVNEGGDDGRVTSIGAYGQHGQLNAPTVFNSVYNLSQFWDGRAPSLQAQVAGPIHHPKEMGNTWNTVVTRLTVDQRFREHFRDVYPDGITVANIIDAITRYEGRLITHDAAFDRFLRGDETALDEVEKQGYQLFKDHGCVSCHQGRNVGGNLYQKFGVMRDYFENRPTAIEADAGRFNVTQRIEDLHRFKVPSLRNVARTRPYFHDGSAKSLHEAVRIMGEFQLGYDLPEEDISRLVSFLKTLNGIVDRELRL